LSQKSHYQKKYDNQLITVHLQQGWIW